MRIDVPTSPRRRCPVCDARKIKRSHRTDEEKAEYPEARSYRCSKCETRFLYVGKTGGAGRSTDAGTQTTEADDMDTDSGRPSDVVYVGIFVLACVLVALVIYVFGRG